MTREFESLKLVRDFLKKEYPKNKVIYIALYGAQNYGLETASSDCDFKAVICPTLEDIVYCRKPISTSLPCGDGLVDVKDIRLMVDQWKKGASNFMELLFTKYCWVSPEFPEMTWFRERKERIAKANPVSSLRAMLGMMEEKFHALKHPYPIQKEVLEKYGYAPKQLSHELRLMSMMERYLEESYAEVLNPLDAHTRKDFDFILDVKSCKKIFTPDEAETLGKFTLEKGKSFFKSLDLEKFSIDVEMLQLMDEWKFEIIRSALKYELEEK